MPWRVCRILDFEQRCTSVHGREEMAKVETARHLAALITKLEEDLPRYAGPWNYPKVYPGYVEDVRTTVDSVAGYLQADDVWGAYDEWQQFMNQWEHKLAVPTWIQVGTVIVEGPGPTVEPLYDLTKGLKSTPGRVIPSKAKDAARKAAVTWHETFKLMAEDLMLRAPTIEGHPASVEQVLEVVERKSKEINIGPMPSEDYVNHWLKLIWQEAAVILGVPD